jgi:putative phosphonate metabolism protein
MSARYALYFAPESGSALEWFGNHWLGRNAVTDEQLRQPALNGVSETRLRSITEAPRHYGFHATLKPPFHLADGCGQGQLRSAIAAFVKRQRAFVVERLRLQEIGDFLALTPRAPSASLSALADACVTEFDCYRAPSEPVERAKRQAAGLSPRQQELLARWGYPYVLDEFRFHLSLTGPIDEAAERAQVIRLLESLAAPVLAEPMAVRALCLFFQPNRATPFRLTERFEFGP